MIEFCSLKGVRDTNQDALAVITAARGTMDVRMIHHDGRDDYTDSTDILSAMSRINDDDKSVVYGISDDRIRTC